MKRVVRRTSARRSKRARETAADPLQQLGIPPATACVLRFFALRPEARPHLREVQRVLGLGSASAQRDLDRLVTLGALERRRDGRRVCYAVAERPPVWGPIRTLLGASDPAALLRDALRDVPGIAAAFVFGSTAAGTARPQSD